MVGQDVSFLDDPQQRIRVVLWIAVSQLLHQIVAVDEERCLDVGLLQGVQDLRCALGGAVVEGQVHGGRILILQCARLLHGHFAVYVRRPIALTRYCIGGVELIKEFRRRELMQVREPDLS